MAFREPGITPFRGRRNATKGVPYRALLNWEVGPRAWDWSLGRCDRPTAGEPFRARRVVETDDEVRLEIRSALAGCGGC